MVIQMTLLTLTALIASEYYCDCVITGTLKWPPKRGPGSDTLWLGLLVHGAGVREVGGSKPGVATTLLLALFRVR